MSDDLTSPTRNDVRPEEVKDLSIVTSLQDANERKSDGNNYFRHSKWNEALVAYQAALKILPKRRNSRKTPAETTEESNDGDEAKSPGSPSSSKLPQTESNVEALSPEKEGEEVTISDDEQRQVTQLRSVLFANIGACHVKLGEHKEAVEACTQALKDNPTYEKALQRRAGSNEVLGTWSSLTAAQEDYNALLRLIPPGPQRLEIEVKLQKLKPQVEAAQKKETSEMLSKLKGLGDNLLGNFGLSTDNFKFEPNGQGGYSVNFVR